MQSNRVPKRARNVVLQDRAGRGGPSIFRFSAPLHQSLQGLRFPSEQIKTPSNDFYAAARSEMKLCGRGGFKDDPNPLPSRDLIEERPTKSGRETTPWDITGSRDSRGTRDLCPRGKATFPSSRPASLPFNFSLSSVFLGPLVFLLYNFTACSGVQPHPQLLQRHAALCARRRLRRHPPPPPRPALPLTSDLVSADPQLDINSRSPKSQPVHPSGPRAGARSPAPQVRGTTSSQSWGCSGLRRRAGGGGQGTRRRRREKGEGCRQLPGRFPAPAEAQVRAAGSALCRG